VFAADEYADNIAAAVALTLSLCVADEEDDDEFELLLPALFELFAPFVDVLEYGLCRCELDLF
jgi:hypothetical protein